MSVLIEAHSKDNAFLSFYIKISQRGSKMKTGIACAHKLLRIFLQNSRNTSRIRKRKSARTEETVLTPN